MTGKWIIGVDGGGSKTDFVLCAEEGSVAARVTSAGTNPNVTGLSEVCTRLEDGINQLLVQARLDEQDVSALFAGLSGVLSDNGGQVRDIQTYLAGRFPAACCQVGSDAVNCLRSGIRQGDGLAVIAGTGSAAFACKGGEWHRVGGWGSLFDDDGSAFAIGRDLIRSVLLAHDGRGKETRLTFLFRQAAGHDPWEMLPSFYREGKPLVASFAPLAFEAWRQGDAVADGILRQAAAQLARLIEAAGRWDCGGTVVLCGGVFRNGEVFVPLLREALRTPYRLLLPSLPPVYGAVVEAGALARLSLNDDFEKHFAATLPELVR